ncbi:hypothetical protein BD779DRAFT_398403 [Infundibulicybe gibba]|nr:hypothetical protein BD779DRAFT_398403 [Infundibulicybe gibba]
MALGLEIDEQLWSVTPLRVVHAARAAKTYTDAFADDPLFRYMRADQEQTLFRRMIERLFLTIALPFFIYQQICLTVMAGRSFIMMDPPKAAARPGRPRRLFEQLIALVMKGLRVLKTAEQKKVDEFDEKRKNLTTKTLGDRVDQMFYVGCLATEPASQGRGYGSALMQAAISLADATNQALWLITATEEDVEFYNMHGLKTMGETVLGEGNETWHEVPVIIRLMVREPPSGSMIWGEKAAINLV